MTIIASSEIDWLSLFVSPKVHKSGYRIMIRCHLARLIVEHEQRGESRAAYGKQLVETKAEEHTQQLTESAKDYLRDPCVLDFLIWTTNG